MTDQTTTLYSRLSSFSHGGTGVLIVSIGMLVGCNFAVAKFAVLQGVAPFAVLYWLLLGATFLLLVVISISGHRLQLSPQYLRYYVIGGILGIGAPQILSYTVLKHIPASFFTMLVTLSPLFTFILSSIYERKLLPFQKLCGILIGLVGVTIATMANIDANVSSSNWILLAFSVPVLLGVTNVYRSKAFPVGAHPLPLATGTLLLWPILLWTENDYMPLLLVEAADYAVLSLAAITALSYILTFKLQSRTDGVGFSQVGYFVTITGVFIGATLFDESIGFEFVVAILFLFLGLAVTNGQINFSRKK